MPLLCCYVVAAVFVAVVVVVVVVVVDIADVDCPICKRDSKQCTIITLIITQNVW